MRCAAKPQGALRRATWPGCAAGPERDQPPTRRNAIPAGPCPSRQLRPGWVVSPGNSADDTRWNLGRAFPDGFGDLSRFESTLGGPTRKRVPDGDAERSRGRVDGLSGSSSCPCCSPVGDHSFSLTSRLAGSLETLVLSGASRWRPRRRGGVPRAAHAPPRAAAGASLRGPPQGTSRRPTPPGAGSPSRPE